MDETIIDWIRQFAGQGVAPGQRPLAIISAPPDPKRTCVTDASTFNIEGGYRSRSRTALWVVCLAGSSGMIKFAYAVMIASAAIYSGGLLCSDANAQTVTVEQYQHPKGERDLNFNKPYLEGIKDGLIAYNMSLEDKIFCLGGMPPVLTFERASDTLLHWARKRGGDAAGLSLGLAMLYSLKEAFPCKSTPR